MIAFNHALTGAVIGLAVERPLLAMPLALLSHFVCDGIPHFGSNGADEGYLASRRFHWQLTIDASLCVSLVIILFLVAPDRWLLPAICAFIATSPDFAWLRGYLRVRRGARFAVTERNRLVRFASRIQWFEKPSGALVELAWMIGMVSILVAQLRAI